MTSRWEREDGAAIVELSLVFGLIFLPVLAGIISYGVLFATQQSVTHAAAEAARATVGATDEAAARESVRLAVESQLSWLAARYDFEPEHDVTVTFDSACATDDDANCVNVTVRYRWGDDPVIPMIFPIPMPDELSSRAVVQW